MPSRFASRTTGLACDGCGQGSRDHHGAATRRAALSPEEPGELRMTWQVTELEWWPAATGCCCWERALEGDVCPHRSPRCPLPAGRCHLRSHPPRTLLGIFGCEKTQPKTIFMLHLPRDSGGAWRLLDVGAQRRDSSSSPSLLSPITARDWVDSQPHGFRTKGQNHVWVAPRGGHTPGSVRALTSDFFILFFMPSPSQ